MNREEAIAAANKPEPSCGGLCRAQCDKVEDQLGALTKAVQDLAAKIEGANIARSEALASVEGMELKAYEPNYGQMGEEVASQVAEAVGQLLNEFLAGFKVDLAQANAKRSKS